MTDWRASDDPSRGGYGASGQGGYPGGDYAQDPNPQPDAGNPYGANPYGANPYGGSAYAGNPYGQPLYGPPSNPYAPAPYGQPPYGYPGYAPVDPANKRPGMLTASAVLGYVTGGLLIFAGIICFFGASTLHSFNDDFGTTDSHNYTTQFVLAGIANLIAAGLLIAGSVSMSGRNANGRVMYMVGGGITIVAAVYWIAQWATKDGLGGLLIYALMFAALVVVGASMAFGGGPNRWLATSARGH